MADIDIPAPEQAALQLLDYCRAQDWSGFDPYDALNSAVFDRLPLKHSKIARLVLTQALKRSPVDIRKILGVQRAKNPKAIALFISAIIRLDRLGLLPNESVLTSLIDDLLSLRSRGEVYSCWGYSFPWQTRGRLVPRGAPNLVSTVFAGNALLDAHEHLSDASYLNVAVNTGEYIVDQLFFTEGTEVASFCYPFPDAKAKVHNANFLAAAFLTRLFSLTENERFLEPALRACRYSAGKQRADGSWQYGEAPTQQWIDNFHTGYNLCALRDVQRYLHTSEFDLHLTRGFDFYKGHFIREDGAVRYFHNRTFPIDIHCVAQTLITLLRFNDLLGADVGVVDTIYDWTMKNMWDARGFFYYRILRTMTIRTSYMRWSQAWMLLALTNLVEGRRQSRQVIVRNPRAASALV